MTTTALAYFFGMSAALLTVVMPAGSVFNFKAGDLLRLPAMAVLVLPSRIVSSPAERGYRARQLERQKIAERLKEAIVPNIDELKAKPMALIDMLPSTHEVSLVSIAIKNEKLDIAKHWIERGAKLDEQSSVLAVASVKGDLDFLNYLLLRKAEPVAGRSFVYRTLPIWQAYKAGKNENANFLIEKAKLQDPSYPDYLFQIAVQSCESQLADEALRHGAS